MIDRSRHSLQLFVDRLTSRSVLTQVEKDAILGMPAHPWLVAANHDFIHIADHVDHACLIAEGLVGRFAQGADGTRQITALHIPGDMPDLQAVVQPDLDTPMQALSPATILRVPRSALRRAAATHAGIAEAFWRDCTVDSMILAQWVMNIGRRDARTRIAHLLCEMAVRYGAVAREGSVVFRLPMTQTQLADASGLTPVHVNRSLKALESAGVTFRVKTVRIADWPTMKGLADFNSDYLQANNPRGDRLRISPVD